MPDYGSQDTKEVKHFYFLLVLFLSGHLIYAQQEREVILFTGTVVDTESGSPLSGVHLICNSRAGTTSDIDGNFHLNVFNGDTILFSHVGYTEYLVPIPESAKKTIQLNIGLTPALTELDEVIIYQWPATVAQLKQRILDMQVEDDKVIIPGSYQGQPKPVTPGVGSPISFLQSKLSKKMRRRQEFLKKRVQLEKNKNALMRYNPEYVQDITGIKDQNELDQFMAYCKLSDSFIADVSEYDLILAINQCYQDFRKERSE